MIPTLRHMFCWACFVLSLGGCAVQHDLVVFTAASPGETVRKTLVAPIELKLNTGYRRTLKQDSGWTLAGRVPQGDVYQPYLDVFTIEGAHIHEAYLVIDSDVLVGFYLPAEHSYSPFNERTPILLKQTGNP